MLALTAGTQDPSGRVETVAVTLTVLAASNRQLKVRLAGSDAPERDQPFGQCGRRSLAELAFNQSVTRLKSAVFAGHCGAERTCGEMALSVGYDTTSHNAV